MPLDDRERSFENALARHLRPEAPRAACPDSETLAAYHERSLAPEQMMSLQAHVSDCARCQEIIALLQATDEIPVAAPNVAQSQTAGAKSGIRVLPTRKPTLWRWVAPAGALAAALLVWVAIRENNPVRVAVQGTKPEVNQTAMAKAQPASPPQSQQPALDATRKPEGSLDEYSASNAAPSSKFAPAPFQRTQPLAKEEDFQSPRKKSATEGVRGRLAGSPKPAIPSTPQPSLPPTVPGSVSESVAVEPANNEPQAAGGDLAKTEPKEKSRTDKRDATSSRSALSVPAIAGAAPAPVAPAAAPAPAPPLAQSQTVEVTTEGTEITRLPVQNRNVATAQMLLAGVNGAAVTVSAPGGRVSWRIGPAGVILFSSDAGKTWLVQPSGIITDLLAGSAPSDKVCWIVGRSGTILRTTDKGKHWKKVNAPIQDDLRSVFAVNARQATVSPANATYQTTDGGATWNKLPPE
jgi:hypothetical protein